MMELRSILTRIRDSRSGDTTDPLDVGPDPWLETIAPDDNEQTDPTGADLAAPDTPPVGAIRTVQTKYGPDVRRCGVIGCGTHTTGDACVQCTAAGRLPAKVDGSMPPPDAPVLLDGAGYVLEPLPALGVAS